MKWLKKEIHLGEVKPGVKQKVTFKLLEPVEIKTVTVGCGCTKPTVVNDTIKVTYTPGNIPYHLKSRGEYTTRKSLTVYFEDGSKDILHIVATIKE